MVAMQSASLSGPQEVSMFTRRMVASVCALALAVPAVASARPGFDPPPATQHVAYGDTKYDLQNTQDLAPKGDTKNDLAPAPAVGTHRVVVPAGKGIGAAIVLNEKQAPVAFGGRLHAAKVSPATAGSSDDVNGWRIAAVAEAGLLAAIALGSAALVGRMRPRRGAHA
jgi:hypothetical protein